MLGSNSNGDAQRNDVGNMTAGNINSIGAPSASSGNENPPPTAKQLALQQVKKDEIEAKAVAWVEAKMAKIDNR